MADTSVFPPGTGISDATVPTMMLATRSGQYAVDRAQTFSDVRLEMVVPLDVGGDYACAEWSATMTHSGPLALADGNVLEPSGTSVTVNGATVAEFRDDRI